MMRLIYAALLAAAATSSVCAFHEAADFQPSASRHGVIYSTTRLLRAHKTGDGAYEERAMGGISLAIEKAKTFVLPAPTTKKIGAWLKKGKPVDKVFVRLKLDQAKGKFLDDPHFLTWLNYADDLTAKTGKKVSVIATLTAQHGDDGLAKILKAAKEVDRTKAVASRVEAEQMQHWLDASNSADDVFKLLKLDNAGDDLLTSPLFNTWTTYQQLFNREKPAQKTTMYATLTAHYGDEALARMIDAAKTTTSASGVAKRVEATLLQKWLVSKQTPDAVFKLLKLDDSLDDVLTNPALNTWANYLKIFNRENPETQTTLIATLTTHYGDEGVSKMLDAAKKVGVTETIATNLEAAQIQHWLSNKMSPASVFARLNLDKAGDDLLTSPLFTTFIKFTDASHAKNPKMPMTTGWIVRAHYDDVDVAKMILAAEKVPTSVNAAKRMEAALMKDWMAAPRAPDHVFEALKLNHVTLENLFEDAMFLYWMKFMDDFIKAFPGKNIQRTILTTTYKDQDLWKTIQAAKENPNTKELAAKLEAELLKQFIFADKQPRDVAKLLNVHEKTDANWKLWKKYMQDYNKYDLREITT